MSVICTIYCIYQLPILGIFFTKLFSSAEQHMCNLNGYMSFATEKKFGKICHEFPNAKFSSGACNVSSSYKGTSKVNINGRIGNVIRNFLN